MSGAWVQHNELERKFSRRMVLLGLGQLAGFGALAGRLYQLQVLDGVRYAPIADDNRTSLRIVAPVRGRILDRNGLELAGNAESFRVSLIPSLVRDTKATLDLLSRIVPIDETEKAELAGKARRAGRGSSIVVAANLTFEQVAQINLLAPQLPGVEAEVAYARRYYPTQAVAHITGYVGGVVKRGIDDDAALRLPGMKIGKSGIELAMETALRGTAGTRRSEVDAHGRIVRHLEDVRARPGKDIFTAIDTKLQTAVMQRLGRERRAAAVVIDIANGDIRALASVPAFDANDVVNPASPEAWRRLSEAVDHPLFNRALSGQYPPGSTFKLVTALAALEAGTIDAKERISCPGYYKINDQTYRCWKRHGHRETDLEKAIRESCDVYFYDVARRTGMTRIADMARKLGFGESQAEGAAHEKGGIVPDKHWKRWSLREGWSSGDTVIAAVGQGFVLATPLQLALMTARIASGKKVDAFLAGTQAQRPAAAFAALDIPPSALEVVRHAMIAAVNDRGGTGKEAQAGNGVVVAGKTGTSQVRRKPDDEGTDDDGLVWEHRDHALFVAYFPAEAPRYAISAVIEHGGAGGAAAAPLVRDIIEMLLAQDPLDRSAQHEAGKKG